MTGTPGRERPVPQGNYVPARRHRDLIHTAGMTPREAGVLKFFGPVGVSDDPNRWREAVVLATRNCLAAARDLLTCDERLGGILSLTVYIAAEPGFTAHSRVADHASDFLATELGEAGRSSRAAVGVASLPGNAPVEVHIVAFVVSDEP